MIRRGGRLDIHALICMHMFASSTYTPINANKYTHRFSDRLYCLRRKVMRYKEDTKTHMLLYAGEGDKELDELEEDLVGVEGKIQGIDKWQIWEQSDR